MRELMRGLSSKTLVMIAVIPAALVLVAGMVWGLSNLRAEARHDDWPVPEQTETYTPGDGTWIPAGDVDRSNPDEVAEAVARISAEHDTMTDRTLSAAFLRSGDLITEELRVANAEPERGNLSKGWLKAAEVKGYSSPLVERTPIHSETEDPDALVDPLTGEELHPYTFTVTPNWEARQGDPVKDEPRTVFLSVSKRDGEWTVVEYGYQTPTG